MTLCEFVAFGRAKDKNTEVVALNGKKKTHHIATMEDMSIEDILY